MATYQMDDCTVVKTENATAHWSEEKDWDGRNQIGRSSRSQWHDQSLYRSRKGRYYLVHGSRVDGEHDYAEWISKQRAAAWLTLNDEELPEELTEAADQMTE